MWLVASILSKQGKGKVGNAVGGKWEEKMKESELGEIGEVTLLLWHNPDFKKLGGILVIAAMF